MDSSSDDNSWTRGGFSVNIAQVRGPNYGLAIGFYVYFDSLGNPNGMLRWTDESGGWPYSDSFSIASLFSGPHHIDLEWSIDNYVEIFLDGSSLHRSTVLHNETHGSRGYVGFSSAGSSLTGGSSSSFSFQKASLQIPFLSDIWVSVNDGDDATNSGVSRSSPLKTLEYAFTHAAPSSTIHLLKGRYREGFIRPPGGLSSNEKVRIKGEEPGVTFISSINAADLEWSGNTEGFDSRIWEAPISPPLMSRCWPSGRSPRFFVEMEEDVSSNSLRVKERFREARQPNFRVDKLWRWLEHWNLAEGGDSVPTCEVSDYSDGDCDVPSRSTRQLIDSKFVGVEDLTGSRIWVSDSNSAHYVFERTIVYHDTTAGIIRVDEDCLFDGLYPTLGRWSSYYLEGKIHFLDSIGEYFLDSSRSKLFWFRPPDMDEQRLENVEISCAGIEKGIDLVGRSYVTLDSIDFFLYHNAVFEDAGWNSGGLGSRFNEISSCRFLYCLHGLSIAQGSNSLSDTVEFWDIHNNEFGFTDEQALSLYWNPGEEFSHYALSNMTIRNNHFHDLAFFGGRNGRTGISISYPTDLFFEGNTIVRTAHNAVQMSYSHISGSEILTGGVLVRGNTWSDPCSAGADCGCLKFWSPEGRHLWKDILVTENICQNSVGWTPVSEKRHMWNDRGMGGFGWYTDHFAGIAWYRNIAYNNADHGITMYRLWEDSRSSFIFNNLVARSYLTYSLGGKRSTQTADLWIQNNVFYDSEGWAFRVSGNSLESDKIKPDHNLYYRIGWNTSMYHPGPLVTQTPSWTPYTSLDEVRAAIVGWETNGIEVDPHYDFYNFSHPNGSRYREPEWRSANPNDFRITSPSSPLIDRGSASYPPEFLDMLRKFDICDPKTGSNYDIGIFEYDPTNKCPSYFPSPLEEATISFNSYETDITWSYELSLAFSFRPVIPFVFIFAAI